VTSAGSPSSSTRHGRGDLTVRNVAISLPSRQTLQRLDVKLSSHRSTVYPACRNARLTVTTENRREGIHPSQQR
jgi:hypothetical protein